MTRRWTTRAVRTIAAAPGLSDRAHSACAAFGLVPTPGVSAQDGTIGDARARAGVVRAVLDTDARVVLLTGHSGSGKSTLMRALLAAEGPKSRMLDVERVTPSPCTPVFDAVLRSTEGAGAGDTTSEVLYALSASGLAEPALWAREAGVLSAGESARLRLACAMVRARPGDTVVCDEFASNLDRASAGALAQTAARWARRARVRFVGATAHEDMASLLAPDLIVDAASMSVHRPPYVVRARPSPVRVERGDLSDYRALERYHYLGAKPATVCRVLRAVRATPFGELLAGVLLVSMPTFNGVWRRQAWPGRYEGGCKRAAARRMNDELRCLSRVIVEPRSRGLGVASALVRAYLGEPMSPATEAVAAMGGVCPFFEAAGMTEYRLPSPTHDARLADALDHAGLAVSELLDQSVLNDPFLAREVARWGEYARVRVTQSDHRDPLPAIARHAVCRLASRPRAYAAGGPDGGLRWNGAG